jgi:hypothetical protein
MNIVSIDGKRDKTGEDELTDELVKAVLAILRNPRASARDKLNAIAHGTKLVAARHAIVGDRDTPDFFGGSGS